MAGLAGSALTLAVPALLRLNQRPVAKPVPEPAAAVRPVEAVAALGRLEPAGDIRQLAAPITGIGGSPRITALLVGEGDRVAAGQLLARFDNGPMVQAARIQVQARINNLTGRVAIAARDLERNRNLAAQGAIARASLDQLEGRYLELQGQLNEARTELLKLNADLVNTELRAPFAGTVLRIEARVGERPGDKGIIELGASDRMEALIEVYESDIERVRLGQAVTLTSENGGFQGQLRGRVGQISPRVSQREVLATDPTGDADARVVEVRVRLDPTDAARVRNRAGLKVVARLKP
ncbi:MAG: HlyD family efflux transporter periplasmic adaptor subunit [Cyanobacteriota bacterium]|nr:HlyD family efflux transporter periplasmic adaptor subunit [Cyanobacteriota bacterium]